MKLIKDKEGYSLCIEDDGSNSREFIATTGGMYVEHILSKQNCDEIFGVVDVNELANQNAKKDLFNGGYDGLINAHQQMLIEVSYINGFNKAMELNKDKLFTIEDILNVWELGAAEGLPLTKSKKEKLLKSLQQPTEIEVEIDMVKEVGTKLHDDGREFFWIDGTQPKLDENDCLILKKK